MKNKKIMILLVILGVLAIIAGGLLIYKIVTKEEQVVNVDANV